MARHCRADAGSLWGVVAWCHLGSKKKWTSTSFKLQKFKLEKTQIYQQFSGEPEGGKFQGEKPHEPKKECAQWRWIRIAQSCWLRLWLELAILLSEKTLARLLVTVRIKVRIQCPWLSSSAQNTIYKFASLEFDGLVSLLEGTAFHIPNFVLLCYIHSRYLLTFIPPIWPSAVKFFTNYIRQSFISESWLNSGKYWGWTYPVPGSKASICLLYQLLQYGCWNSTQVQVLCRFQVSKTTWEPFGLLAFLFAGFQADGKCWAQTQRPRYGNVEPAKFGKNIEIRFAFSFGLFAIFVGNGFFFARKIQSFIIGHWSMYHTAMEQASLVTQCAVAWQNQLRGCVLAILVGVFVGAALPFGHLTAWYGRLSKMLFATNVWEANSICSRIANCKCLQIIPA